MIEYKKAVKAFNALADQAVVTAQNAVKHAIKQVQAYEFSFDETEAAPYVEDSKGLISVYVTEAEEAAMEATLDRVAANALEDMQKTVAQETKEFVSGKPT